MVAQWKKNRSEYLYCSNCRILTAALESTCNFCGATMTNYEQLVDEIFLSKTLTDIKDNDIIKEKEVKEKL